MLGDLTDVNDYAVPKCQHPPEYNQCVVCISSIPQLQQRSAVYVPPPMVRSTRFLMILTATTSPAIPGNKYNIVISNGCSPLLGLELNTGIPPGIAPVVDGADMMAVAMVICHLSFKKGTNSMYTGFQSTRRTCILVVNVSHFRYV